MVAGEIPLLVDSDANEVILASFILVLMASGFNREGIVIGFLSNDCLLEVLLHIKLVPTGREVGLMKDRHKGPKQPHTRYPVGNPPEVFHIKVHS
jgi:hypothetical protein